MPEIGQPQSALIAALQKESERYKKLLPAFLEKNADRLFELALRNAQRPELARCHPQSIVVAMLDSAKFGIPADGVHGAIVPFKGNAQFMPMYKGLIAAARRTQKVSQVWANTVYRGDAFEFQEGASPKLVHTPDLSGDRSDKAILAFYACARFVDGFVQSSVVTLDEARKTMARSPAGAKGPWSTDFAAMGCKTAVRRLAKYLPLDVDTAELFAKDELHDLGIEPRDAEWTPTDTPHELGALVAQEAGAKAEAPAAEANIDMPWAGQEDGWAASDAAEPRILYGVTVPGDMTFDSIEGEVVAAKSIPLLNGKTWGKIVHDASLIGTVQRAVSVIAGMEQRGDSPERRFIAAAVAFEQMVALHPEPAKG